MGLTKGNLTFREREAVSLWLSGAGVCFGFFRGAGGEVCFVTGRFLRGCSLLQWLQGPDPPLRHFSNRQCQNKLLLALARTIRCGCCLGELEQSQEPHSPL